MQLREGPEEMTTMIKRVKQKLKSDAGESIAEVLIALLIAALALTMLASVISTSARMITQSKEKLEKYYAANEELNTRTHDSSKNLTTTGTGKEVTVTVKAGDDGIDFLATGNKILTNYYDNKQVSNTDVIAYWPAS